MVHAIAAYTILYRQKINAATTYSSCFISLSATSFTLTVVQIPDLKGDIVVECLHVWNYRHAIYNQVHKYLKINGTHLVFAVKHFTCSWKLLPRGKHSHPGLPISPSRTSLLQYSVTQSHVIMTIIINLKSKSSLLVLAAFFTLASICPLRVLGPW